VRFAASADAYDRFMGRYAVGLPGHLGPGPFTIQARVWAARGYVGRGERAMCVGRYCS
jgi:hypothetical protein